MKICLSEDVQERNILTEEVYENKLVYPKIWKEKESHNCSILLLLRICISIKIWILSENMIYLSEDLYANKWLLSEFGEVVK